MDSQDLLAAALDIERHVAADGWDQPTLLFALVPTEHIRAEQPELAAQLGVTDGGPALTTFEQPAPPGRRGARRVPRPHRVARRTSWAPPSWSSGSCCPRAPRPLVADRPDAATLAREHPDAQDMRIVVAVMKDDQQVSVLRLRGAPGADGSPDDSEDSVLTGTDLVPGLAEALLATFR